MANTASVINKAIENGVSLEDILDQMIVEDYMTPYRIHTYLNMAITDRVIKPQMMYNYTKNNLIKNSYKHVTLDKIVVDKKDVIIFMAKYLRKNGYYK